MDLRDLSAVSAKNESNKSRARESSAVHAMKSAAVSTLISSAQQLAPLPPSASRLLQLSQNPRAELKQISEVVMTDPALAGTVLALVNTPAYAGRMAGPISSIEKAVSRLGLETLRGLIIQTAVTGRVVRVPGLEPMVRRMTRHTVFAAASARALARAVGLDAEVGFTVGLLHDVGKIVGLEAYALATEPVKREIATEARGLLPVIASTHEEIGAHVAKKWGLSTLIQESIGHHHTIGERHQAMQFPVLTKIANLLAHQLDPDPDRNEVEVRNEPELYQLGVNPAGFDKLVAGIKADAIALYSAIR